MAFSFKKLAKTIAGDTDHLGKETKPEECDADKVAKLQQQKIEKIGKELATASSGTRMPGYINTPSKGGYGASYHSGTISGTNVMPDQWHYNTKHYSTASSTSAPFPQGGEQLEPNPPTLYSGVQQMVLAILGENIVSDQKAYEEIEQRIYRALLEHDLAPEEAKRIMGDKGYKIDRCPKCDTRLQEPNDYLCRECR